MSRTAAEIIKEFREIAAHPEKAIANHKRETDFKSTYLSAAICLFHHAVYYGIADGRCL